MTDLFLCAEWVCVCCAVLIVQFVLFLSFFQWNKAFDSVARLNKASKTTTIAIAIATTKENRTRFPLVLRMPLKSVHCNNFHNHSIEWTTSHIYMHESAHKLSPRHLLLISFNLKFSHVNNSVQWLSWTGFSFFKWVSVSVFDMTQKKNCILATHSF